MSTVIDLAQASNDTAGPKMGRSVSSSGRASTCRRASW